MHGPLLFNIIINDLDFDTRLSKFHDHTKLGGAVKFLEGREASTNDSNHQPGEVQQEKLLDSEMGQSWMYGQTGNEML